jgi:hypothetical protein
VAVGPPRLRNGHNFTGTHSIAHYIQLQAHCCGFAAGSERIRWDWLKNVIKIPRQGCTVQIVVTAFFTPRIVLSNTEY